MKRILFALLCIGFAIGTRAQGYTVKGVLADCKTAAPVVGETVRLTTLDREVVAVAESDAKGRYIFHNVESGRYLLMLRDLCRKKDWRGYYNRSTRVVNIQNNTKLDTLFYVGERYSSITPDYFTNPNLPHVDIPNEYAAAYARATQRMKLKYDLKRNEMLVPDLMPFFDALPNLSLPDGMVLDVFRWHPITYYTYIAQPYVRYKDCDTTICGTCGVRNKTEQPTRGVVLYDSVKSFYETYAFSPNHILSGVLSLKTLPDPFEYIKVPFTPQGIFQAYLVYSLDVLHPSYDWYSEGVDRGVLLFSTDCLKSIYPQEGRCCRRDEFPNFTQDVLDSIKTIKTGVEVLNTDTAILTATWWSESGGIFEAHYYVIRQGNSVKFEFDPIHSKKLYEWCSYCDGIIRF